MTRQTLAQWTGEHPYVAIVAAALAIATVAVLARLVTRAVRRAARSSTVPAAVRVAALAAVACTAYSGDTSWRFAEHWLDMTSSTERAAMFAAGELALFANALMARHNLRTQGAPGTPGMIVWGVTGVQVFAAYAEGGIVGGTVRAVLGPVLAAVLWHIAMGIELRHAKPGAHSTSLPAVILRELRERLLSRLGLATRGRDAEQITRDRWTVRAVALAARLAELDDTKRSGWRGRRLARRLSVAVGRAQAGADPEQRRMLLDLLAARRHATALATVALPSPWQTATAPRRIATVAATEKPARSASVTLTATGSATAATASATAPAKTATASATPHPPAPTPPAAEAPPVAPPPASPTPAAAAKPATTQPAAADRPYQPGTPQYVVHELWLNLGHRPTGPEIVQALGEAGLPNSPQQARKIRGQVERDHKDRLPGPRAA